MKVKKPVPGLACQHLWLHPFPTSKAWQAFGDFHNKYSGLAHWGSSEYSPKTQEALALAAAETTCKEANMKRLTTLVHA